MWDDPKPPNKPQYIENATIEEITLALELLAWNMGHLRSTSRATGIIPSQLNEWRNIHDDIYTKACELVRGEAIAKAKKLREDIMDAMALAAQEQLDILNVDAHVGEGVLTEKEQACIMSMKLAALKVLSPALKVIDNITRLDRGDATSIVGTMTIEDRIKVLAEARRKRQEEQQHAIENAN